MNFYKLTVKRPKLWEKYSIIDSNPKLESFKWFLELRIDKTNDVIIQTTDNDIIMFAISSGAEYNLQRYTVAQLEQAKYQKTLILQEYNSEGYDDGGLSSIEPTSELDRKYTGSMPQGRSFYDR